MFPRRRAAAARLSAEQLDSLFVEEGRERPHRAEELHPKYVQGLALDVDRAHVHLDGQAEDGPDHRRGDAMLARARLGDHALLPHATGEEGLTHYVVELVGSAMAEVFPLQIDLRPADVVRKALGEVEWRRAPTVVSIVRSEFLLERWILSCLVVCRLELVQRGHERLRHVLPAELPEVSPLPDDVGVNHAAAPGVFSRAHRDA